MNIKSMYQYGTVLKNKTNKRLRENPKYVKVLVFEDFKEYENIKNNKEYILLSSEVTNCTNSQDGKIMGLYTDGEKLFVREMEEFETKFIKKEEC